MLYTELTKKAMDISFRAHICQRDKGGQPYVFHPFHLAEQMETEEEICTALLHDVVEDTKWRMEDLEEEGFPEAVLEALRLLTHDDGTPYLEYVHRLSGHPIAAKVKLADLRHNSAVGRLKKVKEKDQERLWKYLRAQAVLTGGKADAEAMELTLSCSIPPNEGAGKQAPPDAFLQVVLAPDGAAKKYVVKLPQEEEQVFTKRFSLLRFLEQNGYSAASASSSLQRVFAAGV